MTIREEWLNAGYSNEYVDLEAEKEYRKVLKQIEREKIEFTDKIYKALCTNWIEQWAQRSINRLAWKSYIKEQTKNRKTPEFTGDRDNPIERWKYIQENGIMPIETIENEDGTFTRIYEDEFKVIVKITAGVIDGEMFDKIEKDRKRLLADYLKIDEEEVINMSEGEIESLVKKNEFSKKINKVLRLSNDKS